MDLRAGKLCTHRLKSLLLDLRDHLRGFQKCAAMAQGQEIPQAQSRMQLSKMALPSKGAKDKPYLSESNESMDLMEQPDGLLNLKSSDHSAESVI